MTIESDTEADDAALLLQGGDTCQVNLMALLKTLLQERPSVTTRVLLQPGSATIWADILFASLLQSPNTEFRESLCEGISSLCYTASSSEDDTKKDDEQGDLTRLTGFFLIHLLNLLPYSSQEVVYCLEYFKLLSELLSMSTGLLSVKIDSGTGEESVVSGVLLPNSIISPTEINVHQLAVSLHEMLVKHVPVEKSEEDDDHYLQGLLLVFQSLLKALCIEFPENQTAISHSILHNLGTTRHLILELFYNCLFSKVHISVAASDSNIGQLCRNDSENKSNYPKCKSAISRRNAFDLIQILCVEKNNFYTLLQLLKPHHEIQTRVAGIAVFNSLATYRNAVSVRKSSTGHSGMLNPRCICYLNSTLQQLFHVPCFRKGILHVHTESVLGGEGARDDMMLQLQYLFASMQEGDQAFVDPRPFCYSFKGWDGRPTNISMQQDASEFLAKFFHQVEHAVAGSEGEKVLKESFSGSFSNELLATAGDGTPRRSERAEPFYVLSVPVGKGAARGNRCLTDALSSFIRGEQVEYIWETEISVDPVGDEDEDMSAKAVRKEFLPTTKRVSLKDLPNHLIIHLKRFDFNFETMQQVKINDCFEFSEQLDMFPYTFQGRVEHEATEESAGDTDGTPSGSPSSRSSSQASSQSDGSIEDVDVAPAELRREECQYELAGVVVHKGTAHSGHYHSLIKKRDTLTPDSNSWFKLNDSSVTDFNFDNLASEAFGGYESGDQVGSAMASKGKLRTKNAFMLVYDRIKTSPVLESVDVVGSDDIQPAILEAVKQNNLSFWNTKCIFDPVYYAFLTDTLLPGAARALESTAGDADISDETVRLLELIVSIVFGTFSQATMTSLVQKWTSWLVDRMRRQPVLAYWLLQLMAGATVEHDQGPEQVLRRRKEFLCALLLESAEADIRLCGKKILSVAIVIVTTDDTFSSPVDPPSLPYLFRSDGDDDCVTKSAGFSDAAQVLLTRGEVTCMEVVSSLMLSLRDAQKQWRNIHVFFSPVYVLARNSRACRAAMQRWDYLSALLSFFLGNDTRYPELVGGEEPKNHKSRSMSEGNVTANLTSLLTAVVALLPGGDILGARSRSESESSFRDSSNNQQQEEESASFTLLLKEGQIIDNLRNNDAVSIRSFDMMKSPMFVYRLIQVLNVVENKSLVLQILTFALKDSKELTETCVSIIISAMKKEDGAGLKPPLRCAMVLCSISDTMVGWRVSLVLQKVIMEIKNNMQYVHAADASVTMFLRICKCSPIAAEWFRLNFSARLSWIESYLITRKGSSLPPRSKAWKPIKTASGSLAAHMSGQAAAAVMAAAKCQAESNLLLLKRILSVRSGGKGEEKKKCSASRGIGSPGVHFSKFSRVGILSGGYDSDDDPAEMVGIRLQVLWKNTYFSGTVTSFDHRSSLHMIHYDDGDKQPSSLVSKVWSLID